MALLFYLALAFAVGIVSYLIYLIVQDDKRDNVINYDDGPWDQR